MYHHGKAGTWSQSPEVNVVEWIRSSLRRILCLNSLKIVVWAMTISTSLFS